MAMEIDDSFKEKVVHRILEKEPEQALELLATIYKVAAPKLRVGTVKKRRKNALAVYVHKEETIYASNAELLYNPFLILHEFYHHIRSKSGEHKGTEKKADAFAKEFIKSHLRAQGQLSAWIS